MTIGCSVGAFFGGLFNDLYGYRAPFLVFSFIFYLHQLFSRDRARGVSFPRQIAAAILFLTVPLTLYLQVLVFRHPEYAALRAAVASANDTQQTKPTRSQSNPPAGVMSSLFFFFFCFPPFSIPSVKGLGKYQVFTVGVLSARPKGRHERRTPRCQAESFPSRHCCRLSCVGFLLPHPHRTKKLASENKMRSDSFFLTLFSLGTWDAN